MIIVYPLLTSANISQHALPGIIKAVEKYILVYNLDDVLNEANGYLGSVKSAAKGAVKLGVSAGAIVAVNKYGPQLVKAAGKALGIGRIKEDLFMFNEQGIKLYTPQDPVENGKMSDADKEGARASQTLFQQGIQKSEPIRVDLPRREGISLEPTWVQIQSDNLGTKVLGVKVVPFTVQSSENLLSVISRDITLQGLEARIEAAKRSLIRVFYALIKKLPFVKGKSISGDIEKDIFWAASKHGKNTFICLNAIEIENNDMFSKPEMISKLHSLGWASFIIADDVNKKATFCMKEFGGLCSTTPYGLLFSAVGKEHYEVYQNISDVKHASGPFFRMNTKRNKIFENKIAQELYNKYSGDN